MTRQIVYKGGSPRERQPYFSGTQSTVERVQLQPLFSIIDLLGFKRRFDSTLRKHSPVLPFLGFGDVLG